MTEKGLVFSGGVLLLISAIGYGFAGESLLAAGCALTAAIVFWFWKFNPGNGSRMNRTSENPTAREVRKYRRENPGVSIHQAVRDLKRQR